MAANLRTLIQTVRQAKTQTEERSIIQRECAAIRFIFSGKEAPTVQQRSRCVLKLSYISMLGYSTEFAQMQVVTLIAEADFVAKRVAYLALSILLDERQEVLTLAENHLKRDLTSGNALIQCLALDAVANLAGEDMVHDVIGDIVTLLDNTSPSVRRKACLVALRIVRKVPGTAEGVLDKLINCLAERNHGVLISSLTALTECIRVIYIANSSGNAPTPSQQSQLEKLRDRIPVLVTLLKSLILSAYATEYDVGAVADPFLQCAILRFFAMLMTVVSSTSSASTEAVSDILAQVATNTDGQRNVGCAVLYECVRTIGAMENADDGLRVLAVNILGRFVLNKDNNIRYVALATLKSWIAREAAAVQRHRMTIMECLRDSDLSLRRKALELTVALINSENVRGMVPDLISYLAVCSPELKADCCSMLCDVVEKFAPNDEWRVETSLRLFAVGETVVANQFAVNFIGLITRLSSADILNRAVAAVWTEIIAPAAAITNPATASNTTNPAAENEASPAVTSHLLQREAALLAGTWVVGEFATTVLMKQISGLKLETIYYSLASLFEETESSLLQQYILTAVAKMAAKSNNNASFVNTIKPLFDRAAQSLDCELQQRACEYLFLLSNTELATAAFGQKMPNIPAATNNSVNNSSSVSLSGVSGHNARSPAGGNNKNNFDDIFGGGGNNNNNNNNTQQQQKKNNNDIDIFGSTPITTNNNNNNVVKSGGGGIDDIFGGATAAPVVVAKPPPVAPSGLRFEAYSNSDLSIVFVVHNKNPNSFATIEVETLVKPTTNAGIRDMAFFVSVLKTMSCSLAPAITVNATDSSNYTLVQKFTVEPNATASGSDIGAVFQARVRVSYSVMGVAKNETFTLNKDLRTL